LPATIPRPWYKGLKEKNATTQLAHHETFCRNSLIFPITEEVLDRAADLWVIGRRQGLAVKDADLMIAATALKHGRELVTGNSAHFVWIPGLTLTDWRSP
jgi:predicted nucleic acid-binding protein